MTTQRLYIENPYQTEFTAEAVESMEEGGNPAVVLNRSCFYPESGGQPWDTGTINGVPVRQVIEKKGKVLHVMEHTLEGRQVEGRIDWNRRFDHMQQHAGQHVLSQAFCRIVEGKTLSFHLGEEASTVEIGIRSISEDCIREVEDLSNRVVMEDRPILSSLVEEGAAEGIPLRKPPVKSGTLRIVEIKDFDFTACGGTHPRRTGEIGLIKITGWEKIRNNLRFQFLCGWRALRDYCLKNQVLLEASRMFSAAPEDMTAVLEKYQIEMKELKKENRKLRRERSRLEADEIIRAAEKRMIRKIFPGKSPEEVRFLALNIIRNQGFCVLFGIPLPDRVHIILARSEDLDIDMRELMAEISAKIEVKGGGRPSLVEMSGEKTGLLDEALAAAAGRASDMISGKKPR
ncbi:MAG: alanine--tRNA ligase-related protein [Candidatus Aminicenantes bacterium]